MEHIDLLVQRKRVDELLASISMSMNMHDKGKMRSIQRLILKKELRYFFRWDVEIELLNYMQYNSGDLPEVSP